MNELTLEVQKRESFGTNANRRLRASGLIPGVVYGGGKEPVSIGVPKRTFLDLVRHGSGENSLFLLQLAGSDQQRHAMVKDIQVDAVSREVLHVDFLRVLMDKAVRVAVAIELTGTPQGVKVDGGVLDFVTREVDIECLPGDIPEHLTLDVTALHIGQHLEASALVLPAGVKLVTDAEVVIASVSHARHELEAAAGGEGLLEAAKAEPQVQTKGKEAKKA